MIFYKIETVWAMPTAFTTVSNISAIPRSVGDERQSCKNKGAVDVVIVGCSTPAEVEELAQAAQSFVPMSQDDQQAFLDALRPQARRLAFYRGR